MIGFSRCTSDGVFNAIIWDVAVLPFWQGSGLGRAMMERLTHDLYQQGIPLVALFAEPNVTGMYEKLGYQLVKDANIRGMAYRQGFYIV